jgi:hypothetical protein
VGIVLIAAVVSYFIRSRKRAILVTLLISLALGVAQLFLVNRIGKTFGEDPRWPGLLGVAFQCALTVGIAWIVHRLKYGKSGDEFDIQGDELRRGLERNTAKK